MANYTPAFVKKKTKHGPNCKELNRCILYVQKAKHVALIAFLLYLSVSLCISLYLSVSLSLYLFFLPLIQGRGHSCMALVNPTQNH